MKSASNILGISRKTISTVMNFKDCYVYCADKTQKYCFIDPKLKMKTGKPYRNPYLLPDNEEIDYNKLPLKGIFAFDSNYNLYSKYESSKDAAQKCGLNNYYNV
jgi:hypothetical protein